MKKAVYRVTVDVDGSAEFKSVDVQADNVMFAETIALNHWILSGDLTLMYKTTCVTRIPNLVLFKGHGGFGEDFYADSIVKVLGIQSACNNVISQYKIEEKNGEFTDYCRPGQLELV